MERLRHGLATSDVQLLSFRGYLPCDKPLASARGFLILRMYDNRTNTDEIPNTGHFHETKMANTGGNERFCPWHKTSLANHRQTKQETHLKRKLLTTLRREGQTRRFLF